MYQKAMMGNSKLLAKNRSNKSNLEVDAEKS